MAEETPKNSTSPESTEGTDPFTTEDFHEMAEIIIESYQADPKLGESVIQKINDYAERVTKEGESVDYRGKLLEVLTKLKDDAPFKTQVEKLLQSQTQPA